MVDQMKRSQRSLSKPAKSKSPQKSSQKQHSTPQVSKTSKSFGVKATESEIKSSKKSPISKGGGKAASIANDIQVEDILGNTQGTFKHSDKKSNKNEDLGAQSNAPPVERQ